MRRLRSSIGRAIGLGWAACGSLLSPLVWAQVPKPPDPALPPVFSREIDEPRPTGRTIPGDTRLVVSPPSIRGRA